MNNSNTNESPLDSLLLAYPCPVDWSSMKGDESKRFCSKCSQNVYNISDLSKSEAEQFLEDSIHEERLPCIRFFVRPDGTIKTNDCSKFFRPIKRQIKSITKTISIVVVFLLSWFGFSNTKAGAQGAGRAFYSPNIWRKNYKPLLHRKTPCQKEKKLQSLMIEKYQKESAVDRESLTKLRELHQEKGCSIMVFRVMLMECLTDHYSPEHFRNSQEQLTKLEEARQKAIEQIVNEIEVGKSKNTYASLTELMDVATSGEELISVTKNFPEGVRKLKVLSGPWKDRPFVISRLLLLRACRASNALSELCPGNQYLNELKQIFNSEFK